MAKRGRLPWRRSSGECGITRVLLYHTTASAAFYDPNNPGAHDLRYARELFFRALSCRIGEVILDLERTVEERCGDLFFDEFRSSREPRSSAQWRRVDLAYWEAEVGEVIEEWQNRWHLQNATDDWTAHEA